ncbi:MAG: hypothetical protein A3K68_05500 [Euryarchaeota archaeon RBG_16_68_13]|nr:MAG: hypothetical protein A3K68_05500 [Euryarchaeota archaeon RBG_16_68_13]
MTSQAKTSCPVCGAANDADADACTACGVALTDAASQGHVDELLKDLLGPGPETVPLSPAAADDLNLDAEIVDELLDSIMIDEGASGVKIECPLCGSEVAAEATRCARCGAEFEDVKLPPVPAQGPSTGPPMSEVAASENVEPEAAREIPVASTLTEPGKKASLLVHGRIVDFVVGGTVAGLVAVFLLFQMYSWSVLSSDATPLIAFLAVASAGMTAGFIVFRLSTNALAQGDRLVKSGRYQEALSHYDRAIRMGYRPSNAWTSRGVAMKRLDRLDEALRCQSMATKIDPENEIAWCNLGDVYFRTGAYAKALESYDRAIKVRPKYAIAWNNKGAALARMNRFEEARDCHDRAVSLAPKYVAAWLNRGEILARLGDRDGAQRCLERARALGA